MVSILKMVLQPGIIALICVLFGWWLHVKSDRETKQREFVQEQLRCLYGPLRNLVSLNRICFNMWDNIHEASTKDFGVRSDEIHKVIEVQDDYAYQAWVHSEKAASVIWDNYAYVDPDDIETFADFQKEVLRKRIEFNESGTRLPLTVDLQRARVQCMPKVFMERIESKFLLKQYQLQGTPIRGRKTKKRASASKETPKA